MTQQRLGVVSQFTRRARMVGWYDPAQLARTGARVLVSTLFASYDDRRETDKLTAGEETALPVDYSLDEAGRPREALWIDYVADLGDGWDSTYDVAYTLSRCGLTLTDSTGASHATRRGDVLVFGGDQVYPTASRADYRERLVRPYEAALRDSVAPHPELYAVPGNHDWYDNLVAFRSIFCTGRWFAGWRTRQRTSYFALRLPHRWWLLGIDVQLDSDIDAAQLEYFRDVAARMEPDDQIVLCVSEPHWVYARAYGRSDDNCNESNLAFLEQRVFHRKIAVYLAGDLHHYRRHADQDGAQKITCGGGGAFLHPTHGTDVDVLSGGYTVRKTFPSAAESRRLCWRNLLFPLINPKFGIVTALLYTLLAWSVNADVSAVEAPRYGDAARLSFAGLLQHQGAMMWLALIVGSFILFTDGHSRTFRYAAGSLHALAHLAAIFCLGWWATTFTVDSLGLPFGGVPQLLLAGVLIFALGWLVGSLVLGTYLLVSLNVFGRHPNEAFSSLRSPHWKSFLRIRIDAAGMTIYPVGIRRVWRAWRINPGGPESPEWIPDERSPRRLHGTAPELIEPPITVRRS